jgi:hypothetical protein
MAAEASGDVQFRWYRSGQEPARAALDGVGLVVLDGASSGTGLADDPRLGGVPRLTLTAATP